MKNNKQNNSSKKVNIWKMSESELKDIIKEALDDFIADGGKIWEDKATWKLAL